MAAVICKTIGELCGALGQVLTIPCKLCGVGCESFGQVLKSPFFPYLALTFALNMPAVVYGIRSVASPCLSLSSWLMANALLGLVHMFAAYYIVNKIRESRPTNTSDTSNSVEEGTYYTNFSVPKESEHGAAV